MKVRGGFLFATCATGALLIGSGAMSSALAADQNQMPVKAAPVADEGWWWHGDVEVGGRFFLNNPSRNGAIAPNKDGSLAKFYEYRDLRPGPFSNMFLAAGSKDGLYGIDFWANNIGYEDQSYFLNFNKAGEHYLNVVWDQIPHVYSTSARTLYDGNLHVADSVKQQLFSAANGGSATNVQTAINNNVHQTDIGIRRDTGGFDYRWTPDDSWDVRTYYSHMHRSGTQAEGVVFANSPSAMVAQVAKPVNDTTQNFGANGEYAGTSFWGQKYTARVAYSGSVYTGDQSYDADDPFINSANINKYRGTIFATSNLCNATDCNSGFGRVSLWPDNSANAISGTFAADLPGKSRYVGTVSYNMMRQNEAFMPFTFNSGASAALPSGWQLFGTTIPMNSTAALPAQSLNGAINTTLINNQITTQWNSDLKSKFSYRYYDYRNDTASILFTQWIGTDERYYAPGAADATERSIVGSYARQNAAADVTWRPLKNMTVGAGYGFERYTYSFSDADATNRNSGKIYSTYNVTDWMRTRASYEYSARRYENYVNNIQALMVSQGRSWNPGYRSPTLANMDQQKGRYQLDFDIRPEFTMSPFAGFVVKHYLTDPWGAHELGMLHDNSWNAGIEATFVPQAGTTFNASWTHESYDRRFMAGSNSTTSVYDARMRDSVETFIASVNQVVIPDKLDLRLSYVVSLANGSWTTAQGPFNPIAASSIGVMPDTKTVWSRLDTLATYKVDEDFVHRMGWQGQVVLRARYAWERNSVNNWQIEGMMPYMDYGSYSATALGAQVWLAGDNPNYNVHLMAVSASFKW